MHLQNQIPKNMFGWVTKDDVPACWLKIDWLKQPLWSPNVRDVSGLACIQFKYLVYFYFVYIVYACIQFVHFKLN